MAARKKASRPKALHRNRGGDLKDEVYRQMFRLEESRPGAEMGLALALLRAWLAAESNPESGQDRDWLNKISPICLQMIEAALQMGGAIRPGAQERQC